VGSRFGLAGLSDKLVTSNAGRQAFGLLPQIGRLDLKPKFQCL
jgi:hypothetical protein